MKQIKVEWCKSWIKHTFENLPFENGGIEINCFWDMAEKSGLWTRGTYGSPMSEALEDMVNDETVQDSNGNFLYSVFRLSQQKH